MEVSNTGKPSAKKGAPPGTGRASLGRRYEDLARLYYEALGFHFVSRNFRWHRLEADLLFRFDGSDRHLLVEVRGRRQKFFSAGEVLTGQKRQNLRRLAEAVLRRLKTRLQVEYFEIVGEWDDRATAIMDGPLGKKALLNGERFTFRRFRVF